MIGSTDREGIAPDILLSCLDNAEEEMIKFIALSWLVGQTFSQPYLHKSTEILPK